MGSLWPARGNGMRLEMYAGDEGQLLIADALEPYRSKSVNGMMFEPFQPRVLRGHFHSWLNYAVVLIDQVTVSETPGPVYSETAMEWEKGK